jgi:hypothetical protein
VVGGLGLIVACSRSEPPSDRHEAAVSLVISHTAGGVKSPPSHPYALLVDSFAFSVHADRAFERVPVWETEQSGEVTTYTFRSQDSLTMRLRVTERPVAEGQDGPSASAVFEVRLAPTEPWTVHAVVPPGPLTERMVPLPDVTGDGMPEILRLETRVPCDGGDWLQVVSVLPELRVLASLRVDGKGCN